MIDIEAGERAGSEDDLYPNPAVLIGGAGAIGPDLGAVFCHGRRHLNSLSPIPRARHPTSRESAARRFSADGIR
jgi:hypothetical protein